MAFQVKSFSVEDWQKHTVTHFSWKNVIVWTVKSVNHIAAMQFVQRHLDGNLPAVNGNSRPYRVTQWYYIDTSVYRMVVVFKDTNSADVWEVSPYHGK